MQSVLNQSTVVEKVSQAHSQNQENRARDFAMAAEEARIQQKSLVKDTAKTDDVRHKVDKDKSGSDQRRKRQGGQGPDDQPEEERKQATGGLIDITV